METSSSVISVVVPFRDEATHIRQCIESLRRQDFDRRRVELIFVDNRSSDGSRGIVEEYPEVRLLDEARPGAYAARNRGAMAAIGDVLAFTDADACVRQDWLREIHDCICVRELDFVVGDHRFAEDASEILHLWERHESEKMAYVTRGGDPRHFQTSAANMAIRKECFLRVGSFDADIARGGDIEFAQRYVRRLKNPRIAYNEAMIVHHSEIQTLRDLLGKRLAYARARARLRRDHQVTPLPFSRKVRIFRRWIFEDPARADRKAAFVLSLAIGMVVWKCVEWFEMHVPGRRS